MHHYSGLTKRAIRHMTLREIRRMVTDIPFVNPHIATPEGNEGPGDENRLPPETSDAQRERVARYGGLVSPQ